MPDKVALFGRRVVLFLGSHNTAVQHGRSARKKPFNQCVEFKLNTRGAIAEYLF